ncbi:MAG: hypothetical protein K940chlam7_02002 [Chlamydiae bacterium]|nr:hypothetical protein [Chlamydiota bacterium]
MLQRIKRVFVRKTALFSLLAVLIAGCVLASQQNAVPYTKLERRVGTETVETIAHSKVVAVGYVDSEEHLLSPEQTEKLEEILLQDKGYYFDKTKKCLFIPEIVFKFHHHEEVTILVGISCNQIKIIRPAEKSIILDYDPMGGKFHAFCRNVMIKEGVAKQ